MTTHTTNLDGWEIDVESLPRPMRGESPHSYFTEDIFPSPDGTLAVVLYSIAEIRMGWEVGMVALFMDRDNPQLILNPEHFLCCSTKDSIIWLSSDLFAVKKFYYDSTTNKCNIPFALIDLANKKYSFVPLANSYPYCLLYDQSGVRLVERYRDNRFPSHDEEFHAIDELVWFDLSEIDRFDIQYAIHAT